MKRYLTIALAAGLAVSACKDNPSVAPIDAPTVDALSQLTPSTLQQLAIGVTAQDRTAYASTGLIVLPEILARDIYRIDASEPRYVLETLGGNADPGSFAGGSGFGPFYTATRAANNALIGLRSASTTLFTTQQIAAAQGFFRTMKALDFYRVLEQRDSIGIPLQTDEPQVLTSVYCKPFVLNYLAALLDSANADFVAAGPATLLPFNLPASWTTHGRNYRQVANLILFNRGLKGKIDFYRAMQNRAAPDVTLLNAAVTELTQALGGAAAGAVPSSQFQTGIYYHFDPVADQISNIRADQKISANNHLRDSVTNVLLDPSAPWDATDTRLSQVIPRPDGTLAAQGLSSTHTFTFALANPANIVVPIPLLKDEELVLLRAQAYAELGGASLALAYADAQSVHAAYGSNPLPGFATTAIARRYILREKRLSLLFQGPQRLVDLRAYGYLNGTYLPAELTSDPFNSTFPIPRGELNARGGSVGACSAS
jgi:starch-binding outer membrane protein, SusD/RagB family